MEMAERCGDRPYMSQGSQRYHASIAPFVHCIHERPEEVLQRLGCGG
ncbi:hypothetical protein BRO54_2837 [Geobacillus proteiniphilus]|uniref:Uncharacterized protein n=1 Tax=Geobacillus proteiniphilus TaxID=860353 RepID=A0A1Q5STB0_9BACL|nr:hypothetical protein BRO54_2837 [Geobacillus proteiniphilus]